jgi:hypothetical protein
MGVNPDYGGLLSGISITEVFDSLTAPHGCALSFFQFSFFNFPTPPQESAKSTTGDPTGPPAVFP